MRYRPPSAVEAIDQYASDLETRAGMLRALRYANDDDVAGPTTWLMVNRHLFGLWLHGTQVIPRYQLAADGTPRPAMQDVIAAWDQTHGPRIRNGRIVEDWALALWLFAPNPSLDDERPYRLIRQAPRKVVKAIAETSG